MAVRIQLPPFDPGVETNIFLAEAAGAGAMAGFTGLVRSEPQAPTTTLTLECYPELALHQIGNIVAQAIERFQLVDASVIHRYGELRAGEAIVQVMTLASHRQAAFDAAEFLMDFLKTDAPFWKKETAPDGRSRWVEAKPADDAARARWD